MEIPSNISSIILRINQSENNWKATFMAIWQHADRIKVQFEHTDKWDSKIKFELPASKNKNHSYTPRQLHSILTSRDGEFTLGYLQILFSLFEDLLNESSKILCPSELNTSKWKEMRKFFENDKTKDILSEDEMKGLELAKVTRNCYIHKGGKINQDWIKAYTEAKGNPIASVGDELNKGFPNLFHQIEEWNELIVNTASKIRKKIEDK